MRPFAEQDPAVTFAEAALRHVVDESQCYPYFIQLWGAALWDAAARQGRTLIDEEVVARASPAFDLERSTYYEHRRDELERQDLRPVAASLADAFAERATLAQDTLNAVIAGARWQLGIPSLMHYVRPR